MDKQQDTSTQAAQAPAVRDSRERRDSLLVENELSMVGNRARKASIEEVIEGIAAESGGSTSKNILKESQESEQGFGGARASDVSASGHDMAIEDAFEIGGHNGIGEGFIEEGNPNTVLDTTEEGNKPYPVESQHEVGPHEAIGAHDEAIQREQEPTQEAQTSEDADRADIGGDNQGAQDTTAAVLPWETGEPKEAELPWETNKEDVDFSSLINSELQTSDDVPANIDNGVSPGEIIESTPEHPSGHNEEPLPWELSTQENETLPWEQQETKSSFPYEQPKGETEPAKEQFVTDSNPAQKDQTDSNPESNLDGKDFFDGLLDSSKSPSKEGFLHTQSSNFVDESATNSAYPQPEGQYFDYNTQLTSQDGGESTSVIGQSTSTSDPSDKIIERPRVAYDRKLDEEKIGKLLAALEEDEPLPESKESIDNNENVDTIHDTGSSKAVNANDSKPVIQNANDEPKKKEFPLKLLELELDDELLDDDAVQTSEAKAPISSISPEPRKQADSSLARKDKVSNNKFKYAPNATNDKYLPSNTSSPLHKVSTLDSQQKAPAKSPKAIKPKAFFEELPISLPKPSRAARPVASLASNKHKSNMHGVALPHMARDETQPTPIMAPPPALSSNTYQQLGHSNNVANIRTSINDSPANHPSPPVNYPVPPVNHPVAPVSHPTPPANHSIPHVSPVYSHTQLPAPVNQINPTPPNSIPFPGLGSNEAEKVQAKPASRYAPASAQVLPSPINTNVGKVGVNNSSPYVPNASSPYVPTAGPYVPSNHNRTHSRASSLVGGKGKETNPYAPVSSTISNKVPQPSHGAGVPGLAPARRTRGASHSRSSNGNKSQSITKVHDPNVYSKRQFPIFHWSNSSKVSYLLPLDSVQQFNGGHDVIQISEISSLLNEDQFSKFPGPLSKLKTKKKDVEKWLSTNIAKLESDHNVKYDEILLNQILLTLLKYESDYSSKDCVKEICGLINHTVDYYSEPSVDYTGSLNVANAFKLDNGGVNIVFSLIQCGSIEKALEYTISRGDWAMSLILASFADEERFKKTASDFARANFPIQKSNNKVNHLMPILLKVFSGNVSGVISDFVSVPSEGEWANLHWKDVISVIYVSGSEKVNDFMCEFGKYLVSIGNVFAGEICFMLGGIPLSSYNAQSGVTFSVIQSVSLLYTEIYEYILSLRSSTSIATSHLLQLKLKHASLLTDYGYFNEAQKYVTIVNNMIKSSNKSPFVTSGVLHDFHHLIMRLTESGMTESGWFGGKISRVNLDKVWGQLDKFIGGDETKKSEESSFFSKYSPSISRTNSVLDFTAPSNSHPLSSPQVPLHEDRKNSTGSLSTYSAPATSETSKQSVDATSQGIIGMDTRNGVPPPLIARGSKTQISKYAPNVVTPTNEQLPHQQYQPAVNRYNPVVPIVLNENGEKSNNMPGSDINRGVQGEAAQSYFPNNAASQSMFASIDRKNSFATGAIDAPHQETGSKTQYTKDIRNSPERKFNFPSQPPSNANVESITGLPTKTSTVNEENHIDPPPGASKKEIEAPPVPPPAIPSSTQSRSSLSNPYAPNPVRGRKKPTRSKYTNQGSRNSYLPTGQSNKDNFSPKSDKNAENRSPKSLNPPVTEDSSKNIEDERHGGSDFPETPRKRFMHIQANSSFSPSSTSFDPPKMPTLNIDDSFDEEDYDETKSSNIQTPQPNISSFLNNYHSPPNKGNDSRFSPHQHNERVVSGFGIDNRLGDFPIPGSPEGTTRANSVIGGPGGLFSSRLSQSQSALYQQYEVEDDTVNTYVPVVEEDEDEEEPNQNTNTGSSRNTKTQRTTSKEGQKTWYSWFGRNDGKNQPIRANLGNKNHFYYDEKLKRWIDSTRPVEEQVKKETPPPIPKGKMRPKKTPGNSNLDGPPLPGVGLKEDNVKEGDLTPKDNNSLTPTPGAPPALVKAPSAPARSLANAGLDDLISIGSAPSVSGGSRRPRKGGKRGYVNVLEKK